MHNIANNCHHIPRFRTIKQDRSPKDITPHSPETHTLRTVMIPPKPTRICRHTR